MTVIQKNYRTLFYMISFTCIIHSANAQDSLLLSHLQKTTNTIGIKYDLTCFEGGSKPWHFLSIEYTRQIKKMPLTARINYANRFTRSGLQLEADAYPAISKKVYAYLNAGYSKDILLFPKFRAGASLYVSLPSAFEAEGGFRALHFDKTTWVYTMAMGKYYKNYWFNLSTFLTPDSNTVLQSYFAKCRYYLNDKDYIMLLLGTGISPDDRNNNLLLSNKNKLSTKKVEFSLRKSFNNTNLLLVNIGFMNQELDTKKYSNQVNAGIGFQKLF